MKLGRKIGIGTRIAAKILREKTQRASAPSPTSNAASKAPSRPAPAPARSSGTRDKPQQRSEAGPAARNLGRGMARGGVGFWKSIARIVGALWHQITGVFFAIFSLFFVQSAWRVRTDWRVGVGHVHFVVYVVIAVLFAYFSITAFVTARHKR